MKPTLSVIIPVRDGGDAFRRCLESVAASTYAPYEVIVVDDGSTDGSGALAEAHGARVLCHEAPQGPAAARNRGARIASGDVLFFTDADVCIRPDTLERVAEAFAQEPDLAALIGSYDDAPGAPNFLSQYRNLLHHYVHQTAQDEASTFWGACGAIRRAVFLAAGGFDESFHRPSIEDIELGYRLKRQGYRMRMAKAIQVKHLKRWTASSIVRTDFFQRAMPWSALILRYGRFANDLNIDVAHRVSVALAWGLLLCLAGAVVWPGLLLAAAGAAVGLLILNAPVYRFFYQKRGFWFVLGVLPWHWFYYLYSGLAFGISLLRHLFGRRSIRSSP